MPQLRTHNKLGASWEGFALECACRTLDRPATQLHFWRTHAGAEIDLLWREGGRLRGLEFKYADAPRLTKSMRSALADLDLEHLWVLYPGSKRYRLSEEVTVIPLQEISGGGAPWVAASCRWRRGNRESAAVLCIRACAQTWREQAPELSL